MAAVSAQGRKRAINVQAAGRAFLIAALGAVLCSSCAPAPTVVKAQHGRDLPASCAAKPAHVVVLGDSLAKGYGASTGSKNFASLIYRHILAGRKGSTFINLGIPGATTARIAEKDIPPLKPADCALVVVVAGANDVQQYVLTARFSADYDRLLAGIRKREPEAAVVVTNLPDVGLSHAIPPPARPIISTLAALDSTAIARIARKYNAWVVDLWAVSHREASKRVELLSKDGLHPNDKGYAIMAAAAYPIVDRALR